ncbi:MAG: insulinase family protein [Helicobacter sp.]|nr:insulinase family protein [Helicobacter sp.]
MAATLQQLDINGVQIPVIYEDSSLVPTFNLTLVFRASGTLGIAKTGKHNGLVASLASALLEEGTKELGSVKFAEELEQRAISISSNAGRENFTITLDSLIEDVPDALTFLDSLLRSPNLSNKALAKVQQDSISDILQKESDFDAIASDNLLRILFKGTPCALIPDVPDVKKVKLKEIERFYKTNLVLNNLAIIAGGDLRFEEFAKRIAPLLSRLKKGEKATIATCPANADSQSISATKPTEQAYIYFGSPFVIGDYGTQNYKAKVAAFVLGTGGFGSRLMEEIRVKLGLAYSAYWYTAIAKSVVYATGYLQTKNESKTQAIEAVKKVIAEFVRNGITQDELDAAKKFLLGSEPLRHETLSQRLGRAYNAYYWGLPLDFGTTELRHIESLTLDSINDYIKSHDEILRMSFSIVQAEGEDLGRKTKK